ncbi:hypothetical protein GF337_11400 [candidate division KSB1 bacterium]|nr:hypothetical protein [candidate division KSB1 bacterium]
MITIIGIISGIILIGIGIEGSGTPADIYINPSGLAIVLGGTIAATLISFPYQQVLRAFRSYLIIFRSGSYDYVRVIKQLVQNIEKYNNHGLSSFEEFHRPPKNLWIFNDGIQLMINGYNRDEVKEVLEDQIRWKFKREQKQNQLFAAMAKFAPAFGMIGTLIGLIKMLVTMSTGPEHVGHGLAIALTTTFYGLLLANMLFNPIAEKIREQSENNLLFETMQLESLMMMFDNANHIYAQDKLSAYISAGHRKKLSARKKYGY